VRQRLSACFEARGGLWSLRRLLVAGVMRNVRVELVVVLHLVGEPHRVKLDAGRILEQPDHHARLVGALRCLEVEGCPTVAAEPVPGITEIEFGHVSLRVVPHEVVVTNPHGVHPARKAGVSIVGV